MDTNEAVVIPPVRCVHCGKVIGHLYHEFSRLIQEERLKPVQAYEKLGIKKYCCRISLMNPPTTLAIYGVESETPITESSIEKELREITKRTFEMEKRKIILPYIPEPPPPPDERKSKKTYLAR